MDDFLAPNGDVRQLKAYKVAAIITYATEIFVQRFIPLGSRTKDQMEQAARSCKQNIVEGSEAATTSRESEIKLTNVALASLGELLEDFIDQLAFRNLKPWTQKHERLSKLRDYLKSSEFENGYVELCNRMPHEDFCNLMITLIYQERYLLRGMLKHQKERFLKEGGIKEQMSKARITQINKNRKNGDSTIID